jgi:hypothetical protein
MNVEVISFYSSVKVLGVSIENFVAIFKVLRAGAAAC